MSQALNAKPHITRRGGQLVVQYRVENVGAARQLAIVPDNAKDMQAAWSGQQMWSTLIDWTPGAWQRNLPNPRDTSSVLAFSAVYACVSLRAGDQSKLRLMLTERQKDGTWKEATASPKQAVLRKPNAYQTRVQFWTAYCVSRDLYGNVYVLKERDTRGVVRAMYVLDPCRVTPLVADTGEVFYRLGRDYLAQVEDDDDVVPASEIIHDRMLCFWHPLVGVSPIYACGMSAMHGAAIQQNAEKFFKNMSRPSGILTAPGKISTETATRLKAQWQEGFSGDNLGKLAVAGDGIKYEPMTIPATDAQLIEQLGWTVGDVARAFHVPPYKLGLQTNVTFSNAGQLDQDYYSQCLQTLIESAEICMDEGLALDLDQRTEFDLDGLLRMDPLGQSESNAKRISGGELAPNEARLKRNLPPVEGGDTPYLQQQNYSLGALAKRDAQADPFGKAAPEPAAAKSTEAAEIGLLRDDLVRRFAEATA